LYKLEKQVATVMVVTSHIATKHGSFNPIARWHRYIPQWFLGPTHASQMASKLFVHGSPM